MCAAPTTPSQDDSFIGTVIADRYQVVRLIGKGGMGAVYEALHLQLGRRVAVKKLAPHLQNDTEAFARLRREAEVVAGFQHPNIVSVLAFETTEDGSPCIVMELLSGEDLGSRIRSKGPLEWPELARIFDEVASALVVAHRAGIVHRDLKPQNIFLAVDDEGRESAKLLDFGLSKIHDAPSFFTSESRALGTPAYMAPEQAEGRQDEVSALTDIWAMGCVLFEMASGELAFYADSVPSLLYRICHGKPNDLRPYRADAPLPLVAVIERCLAQNCSERIASADLLRREVREALEGLAPGAFRDVGAPSAASPPRRSPPTPAIGTMTTLAASCGAVEAGALMATVDSRDEEPSKALPFVPTGGIRARPRLRKRALVAAALSLVALSVIGGFMVATMALRESDVRSRPSLEPSAVRPATSPVDRPARADAGLEATAADASHTVVTIVLRSEPTGANVFDADNRYVGITPLTLTREPSEEEGRFTFRKNGYRDEVTQVSLARDASAEVQMTKHSRVHRRDVAPPVEPDLIEEVVPEPPVKRLRGAYEEEL